MIDDADDNETMDNPSSDADIKKREIVKDVNMQIMSLYFIFT